ncbi:Uncharacterized protein dnm_020090 [Desulfonema magnum]|uniref:Uncharacterized protein n=1 Tax=Desulfonema magnum TaxID=45655 RepID=A0A975GLP6_9BACT|nr:Uncharacterized protein dnm_020090 [Desulfonema magnum]
MGCNSWLSISKKIIIPFLIQYVNSFLYFKFIIHDFQLS